MDFWIKIGFLKKKITKMNFSLKVLSKVVLRGHVGYTTRQLPLSWIAALSFIELLLSLTSALSLS